MTRRHALLLAGVALSAASSPLLSRPAQEPGERMESGVDQFAAGELDAAVEHFRAAAGSASDDEFALARFGLGATALALGRLDEARAALLDAALSEDSGLASEAHYNLGLVAAEEAREKLGEDPMALTENADRDAFLGTLREAERAFGECLRLAPDHEDARFNRELVRRRARELAEGWRLHDREAAREADDPFALLDWIAAEHEALRDKGETLLEAMPSPEWSESSRAFAREQFELGADLDLFLALLSDAMGGDEAAAAPPDGPQAEAMSALTALLAEAKGAMHEASAGLAAARPEDATAPQRRAADTLDEVFRALAPFEGLLQRGIDREKALLADETRRAQEWQRRVGGWCELLPVHAQGRLEQLDAAPLPPAAETEGLPEEERQEIEQQRAQRQRQRAAFEKALQLAPEAVEESAAAETALEDGERERARPHQERVLEILEEIARELQDPEQQEQQQDGEGGSDSESSEPQDSQEESQESEDENENEQEPEESQEEEPQPEEQEPQEEEPDPAEEQEDPAESEEPQPEAGAEEQPVEMTPEEMERLLQKVREREQEYREFLRALQELRAKQQGQGKRDW